MQKRFLMVLGSHQERVFRNAPSMAFSKAEGITTPPAKLGSVGKFLADPGALALAARAFALFSSWVQRPMRIGNKVFVGRHADAIDVLSRDLEFRIGPVNAAKIEAVNGAFILGMDRGAALVRERAVLYRALAKVSLAPLRKQIERKCDDCIASSGDQIDVVGAYARPIAAATAQALFGIKGSDDATFMDVARAIFAHVFLNLNNDKDMEARALS
jgi:cytochrome P450